MRNKINFAQLTYVKVNRYILQYGRDRIILRLE